MTFSRFWIKNWLIKIGRREFHPINGSFLLFFKCSMRESPKQGLRPRSGICSKSTCTVRGTVQLWQWDLLRNLHLMDMDIWLASSQTSSARPWFTFCVVTSVQEFWHYLSSSNLLKLRKSLKSAYVSSGNSAICIAARVPLLQAFNSHLTK